MVTNLFKMIQGRIQHCLQFTIVFLCMPSSTHSDTLDCLTCSYTFAGDGSTDYQCVNDVHNFSKMSSAKCDSGLCTVRTVYTNGIGRINSIYRGCGTSMVNSCDEVDSIYPTCTITCSTPQCNDLDGDLWPLFKPIDPNTRNSGATCETKVSFISLFLSIACLTHLLLVNQLE